MLDTSGLTEATYPCSTGTLQGGKHGTSSYGRALQVQCTYYDYYCIIGALIILGLVSLSERNCAGMESPSFCALHHLEPSRQGACRHSTGREADLGQGRAGNLQTGKSTKNVVFQLMLIDWQYIYSLTV